MITSCYKQLATCKNAYQTSITFIYSFEQKLRLITNATGDGRTDNCTDTGTDTVLVVCKSLEKTKQL